MSHNLKKLHAAWLEEMEIGLGRSAKTVSNYDHYLQRFYQQQEIKSISDITLDRVRTFRRWLNETAGSAGVSLATQNYYLIALRQFLKYLAKQDVLCLSAEKINLAKLPERDIDVLYPEEIDVLLAAPQAYPEGKKISSEEELVRLRDAAILHTLFATGIRISEGVRLDRDDIRSDSNEIPVRGKGNKVRVVFMSPLAQQAVTAYIAKRTDIDPALFVRHKKGVGADNNLRLTARSIQRLIKKYAAAAGITKNITPHTLRHCLHKDTRILKFFQRKGCWHKKKCLF